MASVVRMPSVLAGASEAAIASWLVAPGDEVAVGQPLAEIETEKALVEYAAEEAGVVGRLVLAVGDTGEIGDPIAVLVADGETDADIDAALGTETPAPAQAPAPDGPRCHASPIRATGRSRGHAYATRNVVDGPSSTKECGRWAIDHQRAPVAGRSGRIADLRQPARAEDRRRAGHRPRGDRGHGPEWADRPPRPGAVPGGPARTRGARTGSSASASASINPGRGRDRLVPHTPMRLTIARRLTESKATTPHFYMVTECVVDEVLELRKRIDGARRSESRSTISSSWRSGRHPRRARSRYVTWNDDGLVEHGSVDISIAVATEGGLVTPVLRGVDGKRLSDIARESQDLAGRARERRLRQDELEGGTLSVSNLGMYGTLEFSGIISIRRSPAFSRSARRNSSRSSPTAPSP